MEAPGKQIEMKVWAYLEFAFYALVRVKEIILKAIIMK